AFEPIALNIQYLIKNVEANHWNDSVEIFPLALSDKSGVVKIYGYGTGASLSMGWGRAHEQYPTMVMAATMDEVLGSRFLGKKCLVLVDIEGWEKKMLDGALTLLNRQPKPIWMVEITTVEHQPQGVAINPNFAATFQMFWDRGYEAWTATRMSRRIFPEEVERVVRREQYALPTHNFLFVEEGKNIWPANSGTVR
ncbi:MAG: FkbM family methyltransferase, partial [Pseudomonadota bacterium]